MKQLRKEAVALFVMACIFNGGCVCLKPYDEAEYKQIGPNETAFLIPLEGDTAKQARFDSSEQLANLKVAAKRIQITHRWHQTGRFSKVGKWISNVMLITVDRSPVTREWTTDAATGTVKRDQGIWAESKDSVGFSTGFSVTAMIKEEDTSTFLYRYPNRSLANIMDSEIRARVQAVFAESAAEYDMSELRGKKVTIIQAIREDSIPFFAERGISLTTIGMFGGFAYENPKVQEAIDAVFISQREKEVAAAMLEAQRDKNLRIEQEAVALANKAREIGRGEAEAKTLILAVAEQAANNPVFLEMRRFEVDEARIAKWNGQYPTYLMNIGHNGAGTQMPNMLLNVPAGR